MLSRQWQTAVAEHEAAIEACIAAARRVFGTLVFGAREIVEMPPPGDMRPARLTVVVRDLIWETLYAPITRGVGFLADKMNYLQFLTIRQYLTLVFTALISLLMSVSRFKRSPMGGLVWRLPSGAEI